MWIRLIILILTRGSRQEYHFEKPIPTWPNHEIGATGAKEVASNLSSIIWVPAGVCSSSGWLYSEFGGFSSCPEAQVYDLVGVVPLLELGVSD